MILAVAAHHFERQHVGRAWCRSGPHWCRTPGSMPCRRARHRRRGRSGRTIPWSRKCSFSALRVTPGWITQSRSSAWTSSTWFMSCRSMQTPPAGAFDPGPPARCRCQKAITGTPCLAQIRTTSWMSESLLRHHHTRRAAAAPARWWYRACWSRTACEVIRPVCRTAPPEPRRERPAPAAPVVSNCLNSLLPRNFLPALDDRGKGYIRGQGADANNQGWIMTRVTAAQGLPLPPAPFLSSVMPIEPHWIDYNGHLKHGLLQCDVRTAPSTKMWLQARDRAYLHEGTPRLDLYPPNAMCAICANSPRRSRADFDPAAGRRRKAPAHVRGTAPRHRGLGLRHPRKT